MEEEEEEEEKKSVSTWKHLIRIAIEVFATIKRFGSGGVSQGGLKNDRWR
jgi:hypothetical protein